MTTTRRAASRLISGAFIAVAVLGGSVAPPAAGASERWTLPQVVEPAPTDDVGMGTLLLAFVIGLTALGVLLLLLAVHSRGGRHSLAAVRAIALATADWARERRLPEEGRRVPAAEIRRRLADALQDLRAAFGEEPTAMELAWKQALLEDAVWSDVAVRERLRQERRDGQARAAARVAASLRRAQEREAVERAARQIVELAAEDLGHLSEWETARLAEVEAVVSASILAAQRSMAEADAAAGAERAAAGRAAERRAETDRAAEAATAQAAADERTRQDRQDAEREAARMAELLATQGTLSCSQPSGTPRSRSSRSWSRRPRRSSRRRLQLARSRRSRCAPRSTRC